MHVCWGPRWGLAPARSLESHPFVRFAMQPVQEWVEMEHRFGGHALGNTTGIWEFRGSGINASPTGLFGWLVSRCVNLMDSWLCLSYL